MPTAVLPDRGVIEVSGTEAADFLNRLLTNQVPPSPGTEAHAAALLTPQGKVLADVLIVPHPQQAGGFLLDCALSAKDELLKRLTLYRLRAAVTLVDGSADWCVHAGWGEWTPEQAAPQADCVIRDPRDSALGQRFYARAAHPVTASPELYHAHRIDCGVAEAGQDYQPGSVFAHDLNLDHQQAIDFHKGCYIGQEVVSRMHHRGTARTRLVRVTLSDSQAIAPDRTIMAGALPVGQLGSVTPNGQALALMRLDRVQDALTAQQTLTSGAAVCTPHLPDWAPLA